MNPLSLLLVAAVSALAISAAAQANLIPNGDMELLRADTGAPQVWESAGDPGSVTQKLSADMGRVGGHSLRLDCTAFRQVNAASHAMVCQMGQVAVQRGKWYKVTLWARQQGLDETPVSMSLVDTRRWDSVGFRAGFQPGPDWAREEFLFEATDDCHETTRLQIWFLGTGTLWLDDVSMEETAVHTGPTLVWAAAGHKNLIPNADFAAGRDGWGSIGDFPSRGWPLPLNALFGEVVSRGENGRSRCLWMEITPQNLPVDYFDYYGMTRSSARSILTGNVGWMETKPGASYCFSAWLCASRDDVPVQMQVQPFGAATVSHQITVGTTWQRYHMTVQPVTAWCWVAVGLVLPKDAALPLTVWLDGLQFEAGDHPTEFQPRDPVEAGLSTSREGNVFYAGDPVRLDLAARNDTDAPAALELAVTDFSDQTVARRSFQVPPHTSLWQQAVDPDLGRKGFFRARLSINGQEKPRGLRFAVIERYAHKDSIFGVNHAYPWPHLLRECVAAGILWVRDWSVKWQDVQPTAGAAFDFGETDRQIDRPLSFGQQVLALLPFPSANWSSSAPAEVTVGAGYPQVRQRQAFAPRDDAEFARWVAATVTHYRGRVTWYQVFNEPIYTDYSLPQSRGYNGKDYGRLVKVFAKAAREADPRCCILAGISAWPDGAETMFRDMFSVGALEAIDAVDVHTYPGLTPPEAVEKGLPLLRRLMQEHGQVKPIWLTEHGYYSDDEFEQMPVRDAGFNAPLPNERVQAEYSMRFNVILLANGVDHIFYHAGTCPGLNEDNTEGVFFKYGGAPRKIYAAVAAFADLFPPGVQPRGEWDWGRRAKAYLFQRGEDLLLAAWARAAGGRATVDWTDGRIQARDLMGNDLPARTVQLSTAPVFLVARDMTPEALRAALHYTP